MDDEDLRVLLFLVGEWAETNYKIGDEWFKVSVPVFEPYVYNGSDIKNGAVSMGKDQANRLLKLGISILRGGNVIEPKKSRIGDCLFLMAWMKREGMWWQAERLQNWIHRCQGGEFDGMFNMSARMGQDEERREILSEMRGFTWKNAMGTS